MTTKTLQQTLDALRREYAASLPGEINALDSLWRGLQQGWDPANLEKLQRRVHKLTGNAGAFGFTAVTQCARPLNDFLRELSRRATPPGSVEADNISRHLSAIREASGQPDAPREAEKPPVPVVGGTDKSVYILDDDKQLASYLAVELKHHGYRPQVFHTLTQFAEQVALHPPAALICDIMLAEGELAGPQAMYRIQKNRAQALPVIFISSRTDMTARLAAVRANGDAYFSKPFDTRALLDKLAELTAADDGLAYRVLVVDDTGRHGENYVKILSQEQVQAKLLSNPLRIIEALDTFRPDLVLINTQLRKLSGLELAMVLRQQDKYQHLPLVFFAQQFHQTLRRVVMRGVGDDYLSETVSPEQLVATVIARIRQSRQQEHRVQDARNRDPVSGLYNRNYLLGKLDLLNKNHLSAAYPLAVLYISLDNYRGIEKIMGPQSSDTLARDTAHFLSALCTDQDLLVRVSEDSFAILSYDRLLHDLRGLAESIRSTLEHHVIEVGGQHVLTTASIGIGLYNQADDSPQQALRDASLACAAAHEHGGNQVHLHDSARALKLDQERRAYWQQAIRLALDNDTFSLAFQPIAHLHGVERAYYDVLLGLELEQELIPAAKFIPIAEESDLMLEVDHWVVRHACQRLTRQRATHPLGFFVRIGVRSLSHPKQLLEWVAAALRDYGLPAESLIFDLNQQGLHDRLKAAEEFCAGLKRLGCRTCLRDMDDKTASLQLLKLFTPDFVKLHGDLVRGLADDQGHQERVRALINAVHANGHSAVIAPFVEDAATLSLLWQQQADYIMGHFIQPPSDSLDYHPAENSP